MPEGIYTIQDIAVTPPDAQELGGKGANLAKLANAFPVPAFVVVPASFFEGEAAENLPEKLKTIIPLFKRALGEEKRFAIRSSATIEDGAGHSFAGQFETVLNVPFEALRDAIMKVYQSQHAASAITYKTTAGIEAQHEMAVVIQHMVNASVSGVAFGINPLNGNREEILVNAIAGLGEGLVSGQQNADTYTVSGSTITGKKMIGETPVLADDQILQVAACVDQLASFFGGPQDVEFAFENDVFYLLQSRPVTTTSAAAEQIIWDNSNIVESYPGFTLPLTFSFIEKMYEAVYRQFSLVLGVSKKTVEQNATVYATMLGLLNGKVYYNLNSWYRSLAQLPGYSVNAEFMEKMMGVKEKPPIVLPQKGKAEFGDYWQILRAVAGIAKSLVKARKSKDQFIADFEEVYQKFGQKDYAKKELNEIIADYTSFEQLMVRRWKAPLVNDLFAMIYFGLLQKQCLKYAPDQPNLHNQLIASSKDIITTEPMRLLPVIAKKIAGNSMLKNLFATTDANTVWQQLQQPEYAEYKAAIQQYINVWGERSVAELKLETITYRQQPEKLIGLLQSYIQNNIFTYTESENALRERAQAEVEMQQRLKGKWMKQKLFRYVLKQARYFVSNRENLRYYRTKGFGMVRRMMIAAGEVLQRENHLENKRDVFYLELPEVLNAANDPASKTSLSAKVAERKKDYSLFEKMPLPERVIMVGKPGKFVVAEMQPAPDTGAVQQLKGVPCSAGVVRSKIRIVKEASALQSLNGDILATYATDPGWVVLFPSASGIITERGSLLSHAAIVSREMGIPCIVGVDGLMQHIPDGTEIIMDGSTGIIQLLHNDPV